MYCKANNATSQRMLEGLKPQYAPQINTDKISAAHDLRKHMQALQQSFPKTETDSVAVIAMAGKQLRTSILDIGSTSNPTWLEVQAYPSDKLAKSAPGHLTWPR